MAEPGLRRTPGERVDSEGSRGFESPPLRHTVRIVYLHSEDGTKCAQHVALSMPTGTGESKLIAHFRDSAQIFSVRREFGSLRRRGAGFRKREALAAVYGFLSSAECKDFELRRPIQREVDPLEQHFGA